MSKQEQNKVFIIVSIKDSLEQQIQFNGNIFGNKCCHCNEGSLYLFVCVEVLRPSQPSGVMSSAVSLPNHTFTGQA